MQHKSNPNKSTYKMGFETSGMVLVVERSKRKSGRKRSQEKNNYDAQFLPTGDRNLIYRVIYRIENSRGSRGSRLDLEMAEERGKIPRLVSSSTPKNKDQKSRP